MKDRSNYLMFLFLSIFFIFLDRAGVLTWMKEPAEYIIVKPVKENIYSVSLTLSNFGEVLISYPKISAIMAEQPKLIQANEELRHTVTILEEENDQLRLQLKASQSSGYKHIPARVLGVSDSMDIGAGIKEGVEVGMSVVSGNTLVGKVISVSQFRSKVRLLSDNNTSVPVRTSRGVAGTVTGQLGEKIIMDKVLQKDPLFLDDQIFTSGEEGFPPNLLIGKIGHISISDVAVYKQATIEPFVTAGRLLVIFVIVMS